MSRTPTTILLAAALLAPHSLALAVPTALNLIPTADVPGPRNFCWQLEADGHTTPFSAGAQYWLLTCFGITDELEVGLDRMESRDDGAWFLDAKLLLTPETDRTPALALGARDLTRGGPANFWYLVATKDLGSVRTTFGYQNDETGRLLIGATHQLSDTTSLLADWTSGPDAYAALGLAHQVGPNLTALLYFARGSSSPDDSFVGLNICRSCCWR